ncbi:meiotically up-regulated gene 113-domain-containing protein [Emericellopsis atlantica]|uniref:Meiotically up-regulated gene 113-domain-containing protein n=1 Tax=Emericellopsis atlantica TaxID=2614577 RepID=A0A9P8CNG4_9HYPO|nr:meiotically up-regulated gene 113-domain-containing protein [Emericellopsis atlantica]KAG9253035.1 meiotically up-regulated gene 113-domain-containing protein [Emericellopsis atlantica]
MPFVANTPESLLDRNDSKNPASTCRGLTASGRPCRRPLATAGRALQPPSRSRYDPADENLYCWQHREQANFSVHSSPGPRANATPILEEERPRTSLDTLADRLGLVDLQDKEKRKKKKQHTQGDPVKNPRIYRPPPKKAKEPTLEFCFCFKMPLEEKTPAPRPQPQPVQQQHANSHMPSPGRRTKQTLNASTASPAKSSRKSNVSQTARLKDLIPDDLDTITASAILAELAKPHSEAEEPGYIYMFWLTPEAKSGGRAAPVDAARQMLAPPSPSPRNRRVSDTVLPYADTTRSSGKKTMVLKIGRAANVQRRMNQWQRQCGREVEVLRYYPYSSSTAPLDAPPRTTPHVKKVERLVHIELAGRGLKADAGACDACGREHREWFEVDASRKGVREVDEIIRRWVEWDEGL